jgi:hypothetical protein
MIPGLIMFAATENLISSFHSLGAGLFAQWPSKKT